MNKLLSAVVLALALVVPVKGMCSKNESVTGILYGEGHVYGVTSPRGWVLDSEIGEKDGVPAIMFPGNQPDSSAVIYSRGVLKEKGQTIREFIKNDYKFFKESNPNIVMKDYSEQKTTDGRTAIIKQFSNDEWNNTELVAYIDTPKTVCMVVLTAKDKKSFDISTAAFQDVVKSFNFITDKVAIRE